METKVLKSAMVFLLSCIFAVAAAAESEVCAVKSVGDSVFRRLDSCAASNSVQIHVLEGDMAVLQKAMNLVHRIKGDCTAVLFYASWCPFSKACKMNFDVLSSLFPSIHHFAFEESVIRPSILSRYRVHGFPTLFLLNSTVRVRFRGERNVVNLISFYNDGTGVNLESLDVKFVEEILSRSKDMDIEAADNIPFSWARSPEKLLQQDTYLALASCFLVMKMLYFLFPKLNACVKRAWRRQIRYASLISLYDLLHASVEQTKERIRRLNPCKRSSFQEGAINAREWASKSLASVSLGETSSGRT